MKLINYIIHPSVFLTMFNYRNENNIDSECIPSLPYGILPYGEKLRVALFYILKPTMICEATIVHLINL